MVYYIYTCKANQNMGLKNKIYEGQTYYMTLTVINWVDVFTRPAHKHIIIDSLKHCQDNKGLEIFAWVLMTNHLHMIARAKDSFHLSDILRDFKKFTSKKVIESIKNENESRKDWMLRQFSFAGANDNKIKNYKFWQEGNEPKEIITLEFYRQKLNYIHLNPVRAEIVNEPHEYKYSSAIDYNGGKGLLDVIVDY